MPKAHPIQTAFNAGEFSPLMEGQINLEKRASAGLLVKNLIALKQGPLVRRGGAKFVKEIKSSSNRTALIPFEFSTEQAYIIEVGDSYMRFYRNNSIITSTAQNITNITQASPATVTYAGADTYANGDEVYITGVVGMTQVNGKFYLVANVNAAANTFDLHDTDGFSVSSSGYTAYASGGTVAEVYTLAAPYIQSELFDADGLLKIMYAQSADVLFMAHGTYSPQSLTRTGHASWGPVSTLFYSDGPYLDLNTSTTTLTLSGTTGSVTVTASAITGINDGTGFQTTDLNRLIRWKDPANNWTWLKITARTSTTVVTATIFGANASAGTATVNWRLGLWSDTTGFPRVVAFFKDRMVFAGVADFPDRWDMTIPSGYGPLYLYFAPTEANGTVTDNNAITGTLQSGSVDAIQWMSPDEKGLIIGTTTKEWVVSASDGGTIITPGNATARPVSSTGGAYIKPIQADSGTIFMQRARRRLHDIIYSFQLDRLKPRDLTLAAEHISRTQILGMAFQKEPINVLWAHRTDGLLVGFTYYPDENVFGWQRHPIGGSYLNGDAVVESIAVIPSADGDRDELWLIVKRTINLTVRRYVEYMTRYYEDDIAIEDAFHVDCGLTYDGTPTATITGLDHLEGETVKVMRDGKAHPDQVVAGGAITLSNSQTGSVVQVGLANKWAFWSMQIEAGSADGTAQGKTKRITSFVVRLLNTLGLKYGSGPDGQLEEYDFNQGAELDETVALFTGDTVSTSWPEGSEQAGKIYFEHDGVFPACIEAIMPRVVTQDK